MKTLLVIQLLGVLLVPLPTAISQEYYLSSSTTGNIHFSYVYDNYSNSSSLDINITNLTDTLTLDLPGQLCTQMGSIVYAPSVLHFQNLLLDSDLTVLFSGTSAFRVSGRLENAGSDYQEYGGITLSVTGSYSWIKAGNTNTGSFSWPLQDDGSPQFTSFSITNYPYSILVSNTSAGLYCGSFLSITNTDGAQLLLVPGNSGGGHYTSGQMSWSPLQHEAFRKPAVRLIQAVNPQFSSLLIGTNYQMQVSTDLNTWTNQGPLFTATNETMIYPQYFDVDQFGRLFFRLQVIP